MPAARSLRVGDHQLGDAGGVSANPPIRMTTSFIIHYLPWQARRYISGLLAGGNDSSKAHSSLSPNQLHEGFNLLRNLSAVGAEVLL